MTAYRSMPGTKDNAIARISAEDLSSQPQIKDAVDYCDAVRATYKAMRLPVDFKYSETQAEKLGGKTIRFSRHCELRRKKANVRYGTKRQGYTFHAFVFGSGRSGNSAPSACRW